MRTIRFKKLFRILTDKDEGYEINAICYFQKRPWICQAVVLSDEEAMEKGYRVENKVVQYRCRFFLDLWLFSIYYQWDTKLTPPLPTRG